MGTAADLSLISIWQCLGMKYIFLLELEVVLPLLDHLGCAPKGCPVFRKIQDLEGARPELMGHLVHLQLCHKKLN